MIDLDESHFSSDDYNNFESEVKAYTHHNGDGKDHDHGHQHKEESEDSFKGTVMMGDIRKSMK